MHLLDWLVVIIPLVIVIMLGLRSQRYVKDVSDFLAAGRVAGRYVLAVAGGEAGMGLISVIAVVEMYYKAGFGISFWSGMTTPIILVFALTGYQTYRFRETKAFTMGQFLEIRYSRSFRIFAGFLQAISGILNYALFPAVSARFLIYFLDLPIKIDIFGLSFPTYALCMLIFLTFAVTISTMGGQVTVMVTDCVMGILNYPMYLIIVIFIMIKLPWFSDMFPAIIERPTGESFVNPFDIDKLQDFNLFYIIVGIVGSLLNRLSWSGAQGYNAAAKNAHEQKMGGLLGTWRGGFTSMMIIFIALAAYAYQNNNKYVDKANDINKQLAIKTTKDILWNYSKEKSDIISKIEVSQARVVDPKDKVERVNTNKSVDNYKITASDAIKKVDKSKAQTFNTIHGQMLVPVTIRELLPIGLTGIFCAIMISLMISTDTTYLHSWGSILIQDIFLPIYGKSISPKTQLILLRAAIIFVAIFAFFFSLFFAQLDYILMFFAITGAIWLGGAGVCITLGLYWKYGTTLGAYVGLIAGALFSVSGIILQKIWVGTLYPWLEEQELLEAANSFFYYSSKPFIGLVNWEVTPDKYPVNSQELFFLAIMISVSLYVIFSLLSCKKPFNLEKMLHRGIYSEEGKANEKVKMSIKHVLVTLTGVTKDYTRGDKLLAWSVFFYSFVFMFVISFLLPLILHIFGLWPENWWGIRLSVINFIVPLIIGIISLFWFSYGGIRDLCALFKSLSCKKDDIEDNGTVSKDE